MIREIYQYIWNIVHSEMRTTIYKAWPYWQVCLFQDWKRATVLPIYQYNTITQDQHNLLNKPFCGISLRRHVITCTGWNIFNKFGLLSVTRYCQFLHESKLRLKVWGILWWRFRSSDYSVVSLIYSWTFMYLGIAKSLSLSWWKGK